MVQQHDGEELFFAASTQDTRQSSAAGSASLCELHFPVRYRTWEYAAFMWQHGRHLIRRRRVGFPMGWYLLVKSTMVAVLHFVLAGRARRTYQFDIDEHGIVRSTGSGVTLIDWDDVLTVREYPRGLMFVLNRGTLPIPFRCLNSAQLASLRRLADERKALPDS
jgi:hypothetical protein